MANSYPYNEGERFAEGNPTARDLLDLARINADHLFEALTAIMDTEEPDEGLYMSVDNPLVTTVGSNKVQLAFWIPSAGNRIFLIGRVGTDPLTRDNAQFGVNLLPIGDLNLPAS